MDLVKRIEEADIPPAVFVYPYEQCTVELRIKGPSEEEAKQVIALVNQMDP